MKAEVYRRPKNVFTCFTQIERSKFQDSTFEAEPIILFMKAVSIVFLGCVTSTQSADLSKRAVRSSLDTESFFI